MAAKALKAISVGKYSTTLYTKSGTTYHASVIGGIASILIFLGIGYLLVLSLVDIFERAHYNINVALMNIDAYLHDGFFLTN